MVYTHLLPVFSHSEEALAANPAELADLAFLRAAIEPVPFGRALKRRPGTPFSTILPTVFLSISGGAPA